MSEEVKKTYEELEEQNELLTQHIARLTDQKEEQEEQKQMALDKNAKDEEKTMMGIRGTCIANACVALQSDSQSKESADGVSVLDLSKKLYEFVLSGEEVKNE